jgi:hypothetical protein
VHHLREYCALSIRKLSLVEVEGGVEVALVG